MKLFQNSTIKKSIKTFLRKIGLILYVTVLILIIWVSYFAYINIYNPIFTPRIIEDYEIIARKQKVNVEEFNIAIDNIKKKELITNNLINLIDNPFD